MSEGPFNAANVSWVSVSAPEFFFEPYGTEFKPLGAGSLIVVCGDNDTRHRGVEVSLVGGVSASVWVPTGARVFWLPEIRAGDRLDEPLETRLVEIDHISG